MSDVMELKKNADKLNKKKEKGATMVEYVLLIALIAIVLIVALRVLNQRISQQFSTIGSNIS